MDYYRNADKLEPVTGVSYNQVLDVQRAAVGTEPVSLNDLKEWAKVDNSADDGILTALIIAAREMCEKYTGVNFVARTVTAHVNNFNGGIYLPYGPVGTITGLYDDDGNTIDYEVRGTEFKAVTSPRTAFKAIYTGGYSTTPEAFKTAIKAQALFLYENRGETELKMSPIAQAILYPYKRI